MEPSDRQAKNDRVLMASSHDSRTPEPRDPDGPIFSAGEIISERYKVVRFIAKGGMGQVYEVDDLELKSLVALKTIAPTRASSPRQVDRFRQEIQLARRVSHPNVCRVFDLGRHKDEVHGEVLFLTMELVPGETLSNWLHEHGPMSCQEALPLIRQMVSALSAAHEMGIIHRDFKPGNVMLLPPGSGPRLKITDFGLATDPELQETISGTSPEIVGTPEYMPPEQFRGHSSTRTDVYALGLTVFQMITGTLPASYQTPFKASATGSGKARSSAGKAKSAGAARTSGGKSPTAGSGTGKRIPQRWRNAITQSLAADPDERFETVEEFWSALSGESLSGYSVWQALAESIRRHRVIYGVSACTVVALIALALTGVIRNPFRALPQEKHLAVLPFLNVGNDASNQAFAEGVAESLTSKLSQLERYQKSFWVVPSSDTRNIKSLDQAYRDYGVTLAVTGSIEHTTDGVNLTADLVDPKDHRQLASRSVHVASSNLDELQQRVWESVAEMLDLQISPEIKQELAAGGTKQPEAYELYERGVGYLQHGNLQAIDSSIALFSQAIAKDPKYALPYAGLGSAYAIKFFLTKDPKWIELASDNANHAVELNDRLIPVREGLARVYQQTGQLDKAAAEYQRVVEQDPTLVEAEAHLAAVYAAQGKYAKAEEAYKDAIRRRPSYWAAYDGLGALYYQRGRFTEAVQQFRSVVDLNHESAEGYYNLGGAYIGLGRYEDAIQSLVKGLAIQQSAEAWTDLGAAYMYLGKWDEAADAMKRAADLSPHDHNMWRNLGDSYDQIPSRLPDARHAYEKALETATAQLKVNPNDPDVLSGIALYHAHLGQPAEAEQFISRALAAAPTNSDTLFTSALVYEIIGQRDRALKALDQAVQAGFSLDEIEKEPELRKLHDDPKYQRWLQEENTRAGKLQ